MAKNSLFAVLLRSRWWVSVCIAGVMALLAWVVLPEDYRVAGVLGCFPFLVIGAMAAWRQRDLPSPARVGQTLEAVGAMPWPAFSALLEQAFRRDGHALQRRSGAVDFALERQGRHTLVSARRWKSARTGLEPLRELQAARVAREGDALPDAFYIGLGEPSDNARAYAAEHGITLWQAAELAHALRGLPLPATPPTR